MKLNRPWFYILVLLITILFLQRASIVSFALSRYLEYPVKFSSVNLSPILNKNKGLHLAVKGLQLGESLVNNCHASFDLFSTKQSLSLKNIQLQLGKSLVKASASKLSEDLQVKGLIRRGPVKDTLACLGLKQDELSAELAVPSFKLAAALNDNGLVLDSIKASGDLVLYNGKFKLIDLVKPVVCKFACKEGEEPGIKDSKSFDTLTADFEIKDQLFKLREIQFKNFYTKAKGKGQIGFDSKLDFDLYLAGLDSYLPIDKLKLDYLLPQGLMPVKITGTVDKPLVFPNPASLPQSLKPKFVDKLVDFFRF